MPHFIWVAGLVRQSLPADFIFDPGKACGIPHADPELLLLRVLQPDSFCHRLFRQSHCTPVQPCAAAIFLPMLLFEPVLGAVNPYARDRLARFCFLTFAGALALTLALTGVFTSVDAVVGVTGTTLVPRSRYSTAQIAVINTAAMTISAMVSFFSDKTAHFNHHTRDIEHVTGPDIAFRRCQVDELCVIAPGTALGEGIAQGANEFVQIWFNFWPDSPLRCGLGTG